MSSTTISSKGQITIPKHIREKLNLEKGDVLDFKLLPDGNISLIPQKKSYRDSYGILRRENQEPITVNEMDEGVGDFFKSKYRPE